jgi:hypothetical protein
MFIGTEKSYKNEDDFVDSMGGSRADLVELVQRSETLEMFHDLLPYFTRHDDPVIEAFYKKEKK